MHMSICVVVYNPFLTSHPSPPTLPAMCPPPPPPGSLLILLLSIVCFCVSNIGRHQSCCRLSMLRLNAAASLSLLLCYNNNYCALRIGHVPMNDPVSQPASDASNYSIVTECAQFLPCLLEAIFCLVGFLLCRPD